MLRSVKRSLEKYRRAIDEDPVLREIDGIVRESGVFDRLLSPSEMVEPRSESSAPLTAWNSGFLEGRLPKAMREANRALKKSANCLSLALRSDGRFLFLGDLEKEEIERVVQDLKNEEKPSLRS